MNSQYVVVTKDGKLCQPDEATFPIIKQLENDRWHLIGTAFFIAKNGIFLTAKHVLSDVLNEYRKQTHPIVAFLFPQRGIYQIRRVLKGFLNVEGDVAAGILNTTNDQGVVLENPFYGLSRKIAKPGDKVFTYAYPETVHSGNDIIFKPNFYEGTIREYYPQGRGNMLPNPCYYTSINVLGGASGGPVFNSEGTVIGINSTGYLGCEPPISFISDINAAFNIILDGIVLPRGDRKQYTIEELCQLGHVSAD